ncbi:MAG: hypothetical protein WB421_18040 [Terriglobales bacterium]
MFVRFVTSALDEESHQELGVFHAAGNLRDKGTLSEHEQEFLQEIREWFNLNLEKPTRFTSAKPPYYRKRQDGISWFKASAQEHIRKMREMIAILEHHDVLVKLIKTNKPGYVVYEDEFQIVAVPFADSNL